ncbi:MAG: glycosyltransferase family 2 protein [Rhodoblastus sp.]
MAGKRLVAVFTAYNEFERLEYFFEYYRKMGVEHFLAVDNNSTDQSAAFLKDQPDVTYFHTTESYASSKAGRLWTSELANHYCIDRWCLTLDLDELFVFPGDRFARLTDLCDYCDQHGYEGVFTVFLDMYSEKSLAEAVYRPGQPFLEVCDHFETDGYTLTQPLHFPHVGVFGGPRQRIFWEAGKRGKGPSMRKLPLVKWKPGFRYLHSTHSATPTHLADITGALLHFKFFSSFKALSQREVERGDRVQVADYESYARITSETEVRFKNDRSIRYEDSTTLIEHGVMVCTPTYLRWMEQRFRKRVLGFGLKKYEQRLYSAMKTALQNASMRLSQLPLVWSLLSGAGDGGVLGVEGRTILGWYLDRAGRFPTREFEAQVDGVSVAIGSTGAKVAEWSAVDPDVGDHLFRITIPDSLFDESDMKRIQIAPRRDPKPFASIIMHRDSAISAHPVFAGECHINEDQNQIGGWAWTPDDPDQRLTVAVHIDGVYWCKLRASHFRNSLATRGIGDGSHGFAAKLPPGLTPGVPHTATVTILGTNIELSGSPLNFVLTLADETPAAKTRPRRGRSRGRGRGREEQESIELFAPMSGVKVGDGVVGRAFAERRGVLYGWLVDEKDPSRELNVELLANGRVVRSRPASEHVAVVGDFPAHLRQRGFAMPVGLHRNILRPGMPVELSLRVRETGDILADHLLASSIWLRSRSPFQGYVDSSDDGFLRGWVWRPGAPDEKVEVAVFVDGRFLTRVQAAKYRDDLRAVKIGLGYHAFTVKLPRELVAGGPFKLDVVVAETGTPIQASDVVLQGGRVAMQTSAQRPLLDRLRIARRRQS